MKKENMQNDRGKKGLRVATFNVHSGKNTQGIADVFKRNENLREADIIFLQEIEERTSEKISRAKQIADALGMEYAYAPARTMAGKGTHGLAILSKYPLEDVETLSLPPYSITFHTQSRVSLIANVRVQGESVRIANTHLDTRLSIFERISQIKPLIEKLKSDSAKKTIIGGDFNTAPFRFRFWRTIPVSYQNQKRELHRYLEEEGYASRCETAGYTIRYGFLRFELDGLYARHLPVLRCGVERTVRVSDHKPLWFDVDIEAKGESHGLDAGITA